MARTNHCIPAHPLLLFSSHMVALTFTPEMTWLTRLERCRECCREMQGCIVQALHSTCAEWGIFWGVKHLQHSDIVSLFMSLQIVFQACRRAGPWCRIPTLDPGFFWVFYFGVGFFLSLKSYLHIRLDCDSCRFSNSSGRLPIQKRNNDSDFSDEPMCLCEMFTSPCCLDNRDLCFACLLGGTKRNWFNLEERRFCLDVRKNFLADMGARAQLRTMCHWGLSRRGWAAAARAAAPGLGCALNTLLKFLSLVLWFTLCKP